MREKTLLALLIVLSSCTFSVTHSKDAVQHATNVDQKTKAINLAKENSVATLEKSQLLGLWTDGRTKNASFNISSDSIYYIDQMTSFPYTLKGDSLTIDYPDMSFQGTAMFFGDTLVLSDPEFGTTRFTRFKN